MFNKKDQRQWRKRDRITGSVAIMLCFILSATSSCKKFLAAYSQNQTFVQSATDLDELMVGEVYNIFSPPVWVHTLDDDIEQNGALNAVGFNTKFNFFGLYNWQPVPFVNDMGEANADSYYQSLYKKISVANTVILYTSLMLEKGEPADTLRRIAGEAHFSRAFFYFILINTYGKPYSAATAESDYGIPLKTDPAVEAKFFTRASVSQVYKQMVNDLLDAEKELDGFNERSVIRPNQSAVRALLSRIYLYTEDYESALVYADKVISKSYRIEDLNNYVQGSGFIKLTSPETIFAIPGYGYSGLLSYMENPAIAYMADNFRVSDDMVNIFLNTDLRKQAFFERTSEGDLLSRKAGTLIDFTEESLIRLPEVYLNKAEALALLGHDEEAISTLQELRKNRFAPDDLDNISLAGEDLANYVRNERRRELCFEIHRWFDLRRYGVNSKYPFEKIIRHRSIAYNSGGYFVQGYYQLNPYDQDKAGYVIPVPRAEIEFNKGSIVNEVRPDRSLIR